MKKVRTIYVEDNPNMIAAQQAFRQKINPKPRESEIRLLKEEYIRKRAKEMKTGEKS